MNTFAFLQNINGPEILLIFLIVLLLFGAKRLPELSKSFGKSIREFKKATTEIEDDIRTAMDEEPKKQTQTPSAAPSAAPATKQVESQSAQSTDSSPEKKPEKTE